MKNYNIHLKATFLALLLLCFGIALVSGLSVRSYAQDTKEAEAASPETPAPVAATYVGTDTCAACHQEILDLLSGPAIQYQFKKTEIEDQIHKVFHGLELMAREKEGKGHLCEGCHGPGSIHADDPSVEAVREGLRKTAKSGDGCLNCHKEDISQTKWKMGDHHRSDVGCISCHGIKDEPHADLTRQPSSDKCMTCHQDKTAVFSLTSHHPVKEGRIQCFDCHNPHDTIEKENRKDSCMACHTDERGPFIFEHGAISSGLTDACTECHRPHGSPNKHLLKLSNRGLCIQCHAEQIQHFNGRVCWDCHTDIHGSNEQPLFFR